MAYVITEDCVACGSCAAECPSDAIKDVYKRQEESRGNLERAAVALAKEWRTDKYLRNLEALLIVASLDKLLVISGNGEVIEPDDDIATIGSGGNYALSAARAFSSACPEMSAAEIAEKSIHIAADICVYTNHNVSVLELDESSN